MTHGTRNFRLGALVVAIVIGAVLVANSLAASAPRVTIAQGVQPRLTSDAAIALAANQIALMARSLGAAETSQISSANAVRGGDLTSVEPGAGSPEGAAANAIFWIVRGRGTFVGRFSPSGTGPFVGATGYVIIDDATGEVVGMGLP
jgi:hypothetical protein